MPVSGSKRRFYDSHNRKVDGSTPTEVLLLRPCIRCSMAIISACRNLTSNKLKELEAKFKRKNRKQGQLRGSVAQWFGAPFLRRP